MLSGTPRSVRTDRALTVTALPVSNDGSCTPVGSRRATATLLPAPPAATIRPWLSILTAPTTPPVPTANSSRPPVPKVVSRVPLAVKRVKANALFDPPASTTEPLGCSARP